MEIVLVRHGKPDGASNPRVNAAGYGRWVRRYDKSRVRADSRPPAALRERLRDHYLLASPLARAVHSCELGAGRGPDECWPSLREMDIPRYKLPGKLPAYAWLYINRTLWLGGKPGPFESFRQAKQRALQTAEQLDALAATRPKIAVFGHALSNRFIARALCELGWRGTPRFASYWGDIHLTARATMPVLSGRQGPSSEEAIT